MMKQVKHIVILTFLLTAVNTLKAQYNMISKTLSGCMNYYSSHPELSFDMVYKMYDSHSSSKLIHQLEGTMKTHDKSVYLRLGTQIQLINKDYALVLDDATKTMVVQNNIPKKTHTPMGVDSLIHLFGKTVIEKETETTLTIAFSQPRGTFATMNKFTIDIDRTTYRVTGAVLFYGFDLNGFYDEYETTTIPRIEISYVNYQESAVQQINLFNESTYFNNAYQKIMPVGIYKDYRIMDLRSLKEGKK